MGTLILSGSLLSMYIFFPSLKNIIVSPESGEKGAERKWETRARFYRGWMSIVISLMAAFLFGFVFLIPASFISYTLLLGRKGVLLKILLLSLVTAVMVYMVFDRILGIPTMRGFIWTR